jgi:hypothetical protein
MVRMPSSRARETSWLGLTVVQFVLLAIAVPVTLIDGAINPWMIAIFSYFTLNSLLWWLYLRHERRKREAAFATEAEPAP